MTKGRKRIVKITAFGSAVVMSLSVLLTVGVGATQAEIYESGELCYENAMARSGEATGYSLPAGASRTGVNVNGRRVLEGRVFVINGVTYVPMNRFADWLGVFTYSTNESGSMTVGRISGEKLEITAVENNLYISANGRYFYTVSRVMEIYGEMYVPIEPLVKALNCHISRDSQGAYSVRSGDTRLLKSASQVYRDDEVYWLAKIISAEARGESLQGKIAVGNVVLNRVRSKQFPNTIYGVIFDRKNGTQFTPVANGTIYQAATAESIIAAKICLEGYSVSNSILYFLNPQHSSGSWVMNNREYVFTIGNHAFYN